MTRRAVCRAAEGSVVSVRVTFLGRETVKVGGRRAHAVHVREVQTLSGSETGHGRSDAWLLEASGLPLRIERDVDAQSDNAFGSVRYREHAEFQLTSLSPAG
jgi:hypothetical protein